MAVWTLRTNTWTATIVAPRKIVTVRWCASLSVRVYFVRRMTRTDPPTLGACPRFVHILATVDSFPGYSSDFQLYTGTSCPDELVECAMLKGIGPSVVHSTCAQAVAGGEHMRVPATDSTMYSVVQVAHAVDYGRTWLTLMWTVSSDFVQAHPWLCVPLCFSAQETTDECVWLSHLSLIRGYAASSHRRHRRFTPSGGD